MTILPSASDIKLFSSDLKLINNEIHNIEQKILNSIVNHTFSIIVNDTLMTTPNTQEARNYYKAWINETEDALRKEQISQVILYFSKKGFNIIPIQNKTTLDTFVWKISW